MLFVLVRQYSCKCWLKPNFVPLICLCESQLVRHSLGKRAIVHAICRFESCRKRHYMLHVRVVRKVPWKHLVGNDLQVRILCAAPSCLRPDTLSFLWISSINRVAWYSAHVSFVWRPQIWWTHKSTHHSHKDFLKIVKRDVSVRFRSFLMESSLTAERPPYHSLREW